MFRLNVENIWEYSLENMPVPQNIVMDVNNVMKGVWQLSIFEVVGLASKDGRQM